MNGCVKSLPSKLQQDPKNTGIEKFKAVTDGHQGTLYIILFIVIVFHSIMPKAGQHEEQSGCPSSVHNQGQTPHLLSVVYNSL